MKTVKIDDLGKGVDLADLDIEEVLGRLGSAEDTPLVKGALKPQSFYDYYTKDKNLRGDTGFPEIDKHAVTPRSGMIVILGRTKHGKSLLMANMALRLLHKGHEIVYYSLEMDPRRAFLRFIMMEHNRIYADTPDENMAAYEKMIKNPPEWLDKFIDKLGKSMWITYASSRLSHYVEELAKPEMRGKTVFLDYLQLVKPDGGHNGQQALEIVVNQLRDVAVQNEVLLITGAQVTVDRKNPDPATDYTRGAADIDFAAELTLRVWNMKVGSHTENSAFVEHKNADFVVEIVRSRNSSSLQSFGYKMPLLTLEDIT